MDEFEWDEAKNAANLVKHGISFEEAATIFEGPVLTDIDNGPYDEIREKSFGMIGGIVVACVVHTDRNGRTRIISARKATKSERNHFNDYLKKAAH
ncbi:MAG: BrnT family toxin [Pseudomonadota bacterium]|nr:BrnT family toxin [Pseudomonadota bacterium]